MAIPGLLGGLIIYRETHLFPPKRTHVFRAPATFAERNSGGSEHRRGALRRLKALLRRAGAKLREAKRRARRFKSERRIFFWGAAAQETLAADSIPPEMPRNPGF